jgi:hypothetical protein
MSLEDTKDMANSNLVIGGEKCGVGDQVALV